MCIYDGRFGDMVGDCEQICLPKKKKRNRSELKEVDAKTVDAGRGRRLFLFFLQGGSRFLDLPSLAGVCGMRVLAPGKPLRVDSMEWGATDYQRHNFDT